MCLPSYWLFVYRQNHVTLPEERKRGHLTLVSLFEWPLGFGLIADLLLPLWCGGTVYTCQPLRLPSLASIVPAFQD